MNWLSTNEEHSWVKKWLVRETDTSKKPSSFEPGFQKQYT